jgi:hypothetical protein
VGIFIIIKKVILDVKNGVYHADSQIKIHLTDKTLEKGENDKKRLSKQQF